jgi:hypothetical protein
MYIAVVVLQTLILPLLSGGVQLAVAGGAPVVIFGVWWAFWGVGTRLVVAGLSQLINPGRTTQGILGSDDAGAELVVHELAFANLSMGLIGAVSAFADGWGILGAAPGAVYMGLAGFRHLAKRGKNADETVATWTDLLVLVMVSAGTAAILLR